MAGRIRGLSVGRGGRGAVSVGDGRGGQGSVSLERHGASSTCHLRESITEGRGRGRGRVLQNRGHAVSGEGSRTRGRDGRGCGDQIEEEGEIGSQRRGWEAPELGQEYTPSNFEDNIGVSTPILDNDIEFHAFGEPGGRGQSRDNRKGCVVPSSNLSKGRNFLPEEERQLTRSVLAISQDPICGNQQKGNAYWDRIFSHYDAEKPCGYRGTRSLESKWGTIKRDVSKFIGCYNQMKRMNKSGISEADLIRLAKDLYCTKTPKCTEFAFEHCWLLVREFPRWADGVSTTPAKRKSMSVDLESQPGTSQTHTSQAATPDSGSYQEVVEVNAMYMNRPSGTKAAKEDHRSMKIQDHCALATVKATEMMAQASARKAEYFEEQNMMLLMSAPGSGAAAKEYLLLRQEEELEKLKKRQAERKQRESQELAAHEERERIILAREREAADVLAQEDEETRRQIRLVRGAFDDDAENEDYEPDKEDYGIDEEETQEGQNAGVYTDAEDEMNSQLPWGEELNVGLGAGTSHVHAWQSRTPPVSLGLKSDRRRSWGYVANTPPTGLSGVGPSMLFDDTGNPLHSNSGTREEGEDVNIDLALSGQTYYP